MAASISAPRQAAPWIRMIALGDSLTAGMQDACLDERSADMSFSKLLADQAQLSFNMPHVDGHGIPPLLFAKHDVDLPRVIADYAAIGAATVLPLAWMSVLGVPPEIVMRPLYAAMGQRTDDSKDGAQRPQSNYAVPGYEARHLDDVKKVGDFLQEIRDDASSHIYFPVLPPLMHALIQNGGDDARGSEVDQAVAQNPDLVLLWAGNNDALEAAVSGGVVDDLRLTPMEDGKWKFWHHNLVTGEWDQRETKTVQKGYRRTMTEMVERLEKETPAEIVVMTIPDVTVIPFMHAVGEKVGPLPFRIVLPDGTDVTRRIEDWRIPETVKGDGKDGRKVFPPGTQIGLAGILMKIIEIFEPQNEAQFNEAFSKLQNDEAVFGENDVLDPDELGQISGRIDEYNGLLRDIANQHKRVHLVDTHGLLDTARDEGVALRGSGDDVRITNTFTGFHDARGFGGMFSFDGVHPSDVGHAVLANAILDRVQTDLGGDDRFKRFLSVEPVDEKRIYREDPHQTPDDFKLVLCRDAIGALRKV